MRLGFRGIVAASVLTALAGVASAVDTAATTAFTYQGRLTAGGVGQTASYDFQFKLFDSATGGIQLGSTQTLTGTAVSQGLFTVGLDFGAQFNSSRRWLEIAVRPSGIGSYTTLTPRQEITAAPHAAGLVLPLTANANSTEAGVSITNSGGDAISATGAQDGISAVATSANGNGIYARCDTGSAAFGVWGISNTGTGVVGRGGPTGGEFTGAIGARATGTGANATYGLVGVGGTALVGVRGEASLGGVNSAGMLGVSSDVDGTGVHGAADSGSNAYGVWGTSNSGFGVFGTGPITGVFGGGTIGVQGGSGMGGTGSYGVYGFSTSPGGTGTYGECNNGATAFGVWGRSTSGDAGHFSGNVTVVGNLAKSGGSFKIDHPLDPANKYLYHSFVESPDMMNIYNGNVTLDGSGAAVIVMPSWFEALNTEFRYQLTAMGAPSPNLFIAREITNGQFAIAGGTPGARVSWMVTGIRQDAWANAHRIPVEEVKPAAERGLFLHPELFGLPATASVDANHPGTDLASPVVASKPAGPLPPMVGAPSPKARD
jgi:hypothetical protein